MRISDWSSDVCSSDLNRTAFATLYNDNRQRVYRYFQYRVRNRQLAEDLTQEVFVRALRRVSAFTFQGSNFEAWLVTIARNLYFDHLKSEIGRASCRERVCQYG